MRTSRLLGTGRSFYHVMSRVVDRRRVFEAKDKEIFRRILRNQEAFTGGPTVSKTRPEKMGLKALCATL